MSIEARFVFTELVKAADYEGPGRGVVRLGPKGLRGFAASINASVAVVEAAVAELLEDGCVVRVEAGLRVRNYGPAQDTPKSPSLRNREYRAKKAASETFRLTGETSGHQNETTRDAAETPRAQKEKEEFSPPIVPPSGAGPTPTESPPSETTEVGEAERAAPPSAPRVALAAVRAGPPPRRKRAPAAARPDVDPAQLAEGPERRTHEAILADPSLATTVARPAEAARDLAKTAEGLFDPAAEVRAAGAWTRSKPGRERPNGAAYLNNWFSKARRDAEVRRAVLDTQRATSGVAAAPAARPPNGFVPPAPPPAVRFEPRKRTP